MIPIELGGGVDDLLVMHFYICKMYFKIFRFCPKAIQLQTVTVGLTGM